jgi:hypothetical protein
MKQHPGLHKVASYVLEHDGVIPPKNWTIEEVSFSLGTKLGEHRIEHRKILEGVEAAESLGVHVKQASEPGDLLTHLYRVKSRENLSKFAAMPFQLDLWKRLKKTAERHPQGKLAGLVSLASRLHLSALSSGEKVACDEQNARAFAASFACASVVDEGIAKMAEKGKIGPREILKLAMLNAASALRDLEILTGI